MRRNSVWTILLFGAATGLFLIPTFAAEKAPSDTKSLFFEVDPAVGPANNVKIATVVEAVQRRLKADPALANLADARPVNERTVEVQLKNADPNSAKRIERLLERTGTLEFRIVANARHHAAIIEKAKNLKPGEMTLRSAEGKTEAFWVPVANGSAKEFENRPDYTLRKQNVDGRVRLELLVVKDPHDVNGAFLKQAAVIQTQERPAISFEFNAEGGKRFGQLTGSHLPDPGANTAFGLAIILDGQAFSAPRIQSAIHDKGQITGNFTQEQAESIVAALKSGCLPVKLRKIDVAAIKETPR